MQLFTRRGALVLAVIALLAGATTSYAGFTATSTATFTANAGNPLVRSQGITENVGDANIRSVFGAAGGFIQAVDTPAVATLTLTINTGITNSVTAAAAAFVCASGVTLTAPGAAGSAILPSSAPVGITVSIGGITCGGGFPTTLNWTVSGSTLSINISLAGPPAGSPAGTTGASVQFGADTLTAIVHGLRVNASGITTGNVSASLTAAPSNVLQLSGSFNNPFTIATLAPGLDFTDPDNATRFRTSGTFRDTDVNLGGTGRTFGYSRRSSFPNCTLKKPVDTPMSISGGNPAVSDFRGTRMFSVNVREGFVGAFTTAIEEAARSGAEATVGVRIQIDLVDVPSTMSFFFAQQVVSPTLTLDLFGVGATASGETVANTAEQRGPGNVSVQYIVSVRTGAAPAQAEIPVWAFSSSLAPDATIRGSVELAPLSTVVTPSSAAGILRFALVSATKTFAVTACITDILFPFVTNKLGFDTGISVANAGQDHLGTSDQSGVCTLRFWDGSTTGKTPVKSVDLGTVKAGQTVPVLVSVAAAGFQGYAIATCNFQFAHGFAIVVNGFGSAAGPSIGTAYLGLIFDESRKDLNHPPSNLEALLQ